MDAVCYLLLIDMGQSYEVAVWRKNSKGWKCIDASDLLYWMKSLNVKQVGEEVKRIGYKYTWIRENDPRPHVS